MTARVQYLEKNNIKYLCNNRLHCTVVQIVLLYSVNQQYRLMKTCSMWLKWHNQCQSDYHEANDKRNPLWRKHVHIVLHIVLLSKTTE